VPSTHELETQWLYNTTGMAKGTDIAVVVVVQNGQVLTYDLCKRIDNNSIIDMSGTDLQVGKVYVYLAFAQPPAPNTNEPGIVSVTHYREMNITVVRSADTETDKKTEKKE
jgi:hypothetical protein